MASDLAWSRTGAGPPLVLLHGGGPGCSAEDDFAEVLADFARVRTVVAVDLHQYGRSPSVRIAGPAVDHHAAAVEQLFDELEITGADLVCQSLGSLVALRLAARRPDLVRRLVLTGTQPVRGEPEDSRWDLGPRVRTELFGPGEVDLTRMRRLMAEAEWSDPTRIPDALVERRLATALRHHAVVAGDDPTGRGTPRPLDDVLGAVRAPTLLLWGADDAFATPAYARTLAGLLPAATVDVVPDAGHHVQSERPEPYRRAALDFLLSA